MPQRPDTLETVLLAVELLRRIPRGRKVTTGELHQQLRSAGFDRDLRVVDVLGARDFPHRRDRPRMRRLR